MHYNRGSSYLFVNGVQISKFNTKYSAINTNQPCLWNVSKNFSVNNIKNIGLHRCVYGFSVDYDATAVDDTLDIHRYSRRKYNIK